MTVLTTLQCNFACDYCFQGDHGDYNKFAAKMTMETADRVAAFTEERLDTLKPGSFVLTLFGGEPLLNLPVAYYLAERLWQASQARGVKMQLNVITNGLLLTPEVVDRLAPCGLNAVKITLDGDHDTHNRMRPLRGGQGTFDKIIQNVRAVAGKCRISIGGNFDESSVDSYPALLDFLKEQDFADKIARVAFKPVIREPKPQQPKGMIPLTVVGAGNKPLNGTCMTSAGSGTSSASVCDTCNFLDEKMSFLRDETKKRGFVTMDGVHMGPCEIHREHAHTIGPDGAMYACPGFTGDAKQSTGHIDGRHDAVRQQRGVAVRPAGSVEGVQRLRLHPRLCRRVLGRGAHRTRQHEPAELPQEHLRIRCRLACPRCGIRPDDLDQLAVSSERTEDSGHEERQKRRRQEKDPPAAVARGCSRRAPAVTGGDDTRSPSIQFREDRP